MVTRVFAISASQHLALHAGADVGTWDVVAAVSDDVPATLWVSEGADVLTLAGVDLLDELLGGADVAEAALCEIKDGGTTFDVVLFAELGAAAAERIKSAEAAQQAVLVECQSDGATVHAGTTVPASAETSNTAVAATVEKAERPALLAAKESVVSLSGTAHHVLSLELDVHFIGSASFVPHCEFEWVACDYTNAHTHRHKRGGEESSLSQKKNEKFRGFMSTAVSQVSPSTSRRWSRWLGSDTSSIHHESVATTTGQTKQPHFYALQRRT